MITPTAKWDRGQSDVTALPPVRWWESAKDGRIFCGPKPQGHHMPARFRVNESGFVQCQAKSGLSLELLDLKRLRDSRQFADADRLERAMRTRGVEPPTQQQLREMERQTGMCGRWVFLLTIRGGGAIVAEVTPDERDEMAELSTPAAMIEYLGIFPRR